MEKDYENKRNEIFADEQRKIRENQKWAEDKANEMENDTHLKDHGMKPMTEDYLRALQKPENAVKRSEIEIVNEAGRRADAQVVNEQKSERMGLSRGEKVALRMKEKREAKARDQNRDSDKSRNRDRER